ncbi:hypothetical protein [Kitasatospora sp. NPDC051914]|uniref:hypothetical protein n=1 Tax=Kitasatospora sp. NPDC051914 TaxID=3154945 RepID=UPI00343E489A
MSGTFIRTDSATGLPVGTEAVFLTLGSALVALFPTGGTNEHGAPTFHWSCNGCRDCSYYAELRGTARNRANAHAADCRALPWPAFGDQD